MNHLFDKITMSEHFVTKAFKASTYLIVGLTAGFSSCAGDEASLTGTLTGVESDTLLVFSSYMNEKASFRNDTIPLVNNHFEISYPDTALFINIVAKPKDPNGAIRMSKNGPVLFFPGDKLCVKGSIEHFEVTGSDLYDGLQKYPDIQRMQGEMSEMTRALEQAYEAKDDSAKKRIQEDLKSMFDHIRDVKFEVVKNDPSSMTSAYFATQLRPKEGLEAIKLLTDDVKNGPMQGLIQKAQQAYENNLIRLEARAQMKPGNMAPDFSLLTLEGKEVSLKSFHGKYLLVDFWGTWCGWCIKGMPTMKKYYNKYNKQIEFLGVCCGDTEKKWREGVAANQLPWVNVLEGDSRMSARYGVGAFPTKVLLDPEGKIVKVFVGENPALYQQLDSLFKK